MPHVIASVWSRLGRRLRHDDANPTCCNQIISKLQRYTSAFATVNSAVGKTNPVTHRLIGYRKVFAALVRRVERRLFPVHGIGSDPILYFVLAGAWLAPVNTN